MPYALFFIGIAMLLSAAFGLVSGMGLPLMVIGTLLIIASLYLWRLQPF